MIKAKKISIGILIAIIIVALSAIAGTQIVKAFYADQADQKVTLGYSNLTNDKDILCIEHHQALGWSTTYTVTSKVHIEGKTSTDHKGKSISSWDNAKLAYILSSYKPSNQFYENTDVQQATWNFMSTWMNNVGQNHAGLNAAFTNGVKGSWHTGLEDRANGYANALGDDKISNKTNEDKIKVESYKNGQETDLKIGPFKVEFGGTLTDVKLSDKNGKTISPKAYGKYSGKDFKTVGLNEIQSGESFYIIIPAKSGLASINHIKMTSTSTVKVVDIVFYRSGIDSWQNLIQYAPSEKTINTDGDWDVKIPLLINISGFVWEDQLTGKDSDAGLDGIYYENGTEYKDKDGKKRTSTDVLVEGIIVRLKDQNGNIVKNNEDKEAVAKTDSNGKYKFTDLLISELETYYVEFEYDGLTYTSVATLEGDDYTRNSKAKEVVKERQDVNSAFTKITNKDGDTSARSQGYARNGDKKVSLNYENNATDGLSTFDINKNNNDAKAAATLTANTDEVEKLYLNNRFAAGERELSKDDGKGYVVNEDGSIEITKVSFGIVKRAQPQISILKDMENVRVDINGYHNIYTKDSSGNQYAKKQEDATDSIQNESPNVLVKFKREYMNSYTREIYPSDVQYSLDNRADPNKLKVSITYAITIYNNTPGVITSINELVDYYDKDYTIDKCWVGDSEEKTINFTNGNANGDYQAAYITGIDKIAGGKNVTVHVRFVVKDDAVLDLLNNNCKLDNVAEINSYSTYYADAREGCKAGDVYAGVDTVSAPGNAKPGDRATYEADTDGAPGLVLVAKGVRQLEGTAFEDATAKELQPGKIREGYGEYKDGENTVSGVKVELLRIDNEGDLAVATVYPNSTNGDEENGIAGQNGVPAETTTDNHGYYIFKGIEPDKYLIRYTYKNGQTKICDTNGNVIEDKKVSVQNYKSTVVKDPIKGIFVSQDSAGNDPAKMNDEMLKWYKDKQPETRYTDARDDYIQRQAIDDELKAVDNTLQQKIKDSITAGENGEAYTGIQIELWADTPWFDIPLEYDTIITASAKNEFIHKISNVDFGISERPRQSATLEKEVSNIKVTLPNGQVLVDGDPNKKLDYVTAIKDENGKIQEIYVTIDSELLYGSQIEIKYKLTLTNTSEWDYVNKTYYYYGKDGGDLSNPVELSSSTLIDYVDSELVLSSSNNEVWNIKDIAKDGISLDSTVDKEELKKQYSTIVTAEAIREGAIQPGDSTETYINVEKLLSTSDQKLSYNNNGEVINIRKTGGSNMAATLGSYAAVLVNDPEAGPEEVNGLVETDEAKAEVTTIIPPTGATDNTVTYVIIGVASLVLLGGGVFVVRRIVKL